MQFNIFLRWFRLFLPIIVGAILWQCSTPDTLAIEGWHMLIIFLSTLLGVMIAPLPMSAVTLSGIIALEATHTVPLKEALSGYSEPITWLIVFAFFISSGFLKTGLGIRIAYCFMGLLGKRTLTLSYGLALTDLLLAPAMPSITARAGAVVQPIMQSIAEIYDSHANNKDSAARMGSFLTLSVFHVNAITSAIFLTAMAGNPLVIKIAAEYDITISWGDWATAALLPGLLSLCIAPLCLYLLAPPTIKETPEAVTIAKDELKKMGAISAPEWIMILVFIALLALWVVGSALGLSATLVAMFGVTILIITQVLKWEDIVSNKGAWDTMIWFGAFITMAKYLSTYGVIHYMSEQLSIVSQGLALWQTLLFLGVVYYIFHYLFASATAQISAMYASFLVVLLQAGAPAMSAALLLAFLSSLSAVVTHYGNGPAPILFGTRYVTLSVWWRIGALMSIIYLLIWLGIGGLWLQWLGYS